jgi:putative pantetheine hydrolase
MGHDGLARGIHPVHTMRDGDTVFTLATGAGPVPEPEAMHTLLTESGDCVTRAIARALVAATSAGGMRCCREAFPSAFVNTA